STDARLSRRHGCRYVRPSGGPAVSPIHRPGAAAGRDGEDRPPGAVARDHPGGGMIFLVGYRGTGKTTVARLLAERLGWSWLDADEVLEARFGQSISDIFAADGESAFRLMEASVLDDLCRLKKHVIATGGGVVLSATNREHMRQTGHVVWLVADVDTIC